MADHVLDAKGLNCPLPILKAKKALKDVPAGAPVEIEMIVEIALTPDELKALHASAAEVRTTYTRLKEL